MRVLVTGASGFLGTALLKKLKLAAGIDARGSIRKALFTADTLSKLVVVGELSSQTLWTAALEGVDVVVHTAARVHVMNDISAGALEKFRAINVEATCHLAEMAVLADVKRFIFISSIKVNGEFTNTMQPYKADDAPAPKDFYGISKLEAEIKLREISQRSGMELVIIRPPLIYGPGVKANFALMMRWIKRRVPLPLGAINNLRSFVSIDNIVDLIQVCLVHPAASGQIFLVSDGEDVSTTKLLRKIAEALGVDCTMLPLPSGFIRLVATLFGRKESAQRLFSSLQVDIEKTRTLLGWTPPITLTEGLRQTVAHVT